MSRVGWIALIALIAGGDEAAADHGLPPVPRDVAPETSESATPGTASVSTDLSMTDYRVDGATGDIVSASLAGSVILPLRLAVRARLPVHRIVDDASGSAEDGIGDLVLGVDRGFALAARIQLRPGLDLLLPTGDRDRGLGHGAIAVAPRIDASRPIGHAFVAIAGASLLANLIESGDGGGVIAERRADTELRAEAGGGYDHDRWRAVSTLRISAPLGDDPDAGALFVTAAPSITARLSPVWIISAYGELPLRATRRLDWQAGIRATLRWSLR